MSEPALISNPAPKSSSAASPPAPAAAGRFEHGRFRAGRGYELVVADRFTPDEIAMFGELIRQPDFYGVLRPTHPDHTYRTADRNLALLFLTLSEPGPIPFFARSAEAMSDLEELVLDGIMEVEAADGSFLAGAAASELFSLSAEAAGGHPLQRLAAEALELAARLAAREADGVDGAEGRRARIAAFLYHYNRIPAPVGLERDLDTPDRVLAFLTSGAGTVARGSLTRDWRRLDPGEAGEGWIHFRSRRDGSTADGAIQGTYKLYVSPRLEGLPAAFAALLEALADRPAAFKVGNDAAGLLRPDKLVVYFSRQTELLEVAESLRSRLGEVDAHGVPLTAPIDPAGLLSWGVDPPAGARVLSWQGQESWRSWLVSRLASLLVQAIAGHGEEERAEKYDPSAAVAFARQRLARQGVDVDRWLPTATLFRTA